MTQVKPKKNITRIILSAVLFGLAAILLVTAVVGYVIRGFDSTGDALHTMRTDAVLHAASSGIVDSLATDANAAKLKELRAMPDFRSMGMDEVKAKCAEAEKQARAEAEALYSNPQNVDRDALVAAIDPLEAALADYSQLESAEKAAYAELYTSLFESVTDWTDLAASEDDEVLFAEMVKLVPALADEGNAHLKSGFIKLARKQAKDEAAKDAKELYNQLYTGLVGLVTDWSALPADDDETLWAALVELMPALGNNESVKADILKAVKANVKTVAEGGTVTVPEAAEATVEETAVIVSYSNFEESDALQAKAATVDTVYEALWAELLKAIPDLDSLPKKMKNTIRENVETVANTSALDFSTRYGIYAAQKADQNFTGSTAMMMTLASSAEQILIAGIAVLLLALVYFFWKPLSKRMGIPRTIITLFFIYLCLAAQLYHMDVSMLLSNVLVRVGMYGVLVLAMLPGIQCGIGLNMGMTLGCIAGLLSTVIALQYDLTGYPALIFSVVIGALIALPLGWAYSKLLNRMKGDEMTISTYVGYSFVSLMCIGWMLLPFTNTKIIWLLSGRGLRVTHSLLGSFAHLLDNAGAFKIFGVEIPTGLIAFFLLCCGLMWLFSRSKAGIAMTAAGSNPRFAEASGINVDRMRTMGTVLSTMIAAVGIVIYSQAFGYAQLYTAPRQLGFIAASAILIGGATVSKAKVSHVIIGVFLFEGVLALGQQIANAAVAGGGLSEVMRILISNGIILYALTQSGGASRE